LDTAKIFWSGRSQAVRLPKEYRFEGTEVRIRRQGRAVVLEPVVAEKDEWAWLDKVIGPVDDNFKRAVESIRSEPPQERPEVDEFFK
jgi:antitoxin VapB